MLGGKVTVLRIVPLLPDLYYVPLFFPHLCLYLLWVAFGMRGLEKKDHIPKLFLLSFNNNNILPFPLHHFSHTRVTFYCLYMYMYYT